MLETTKARLAASGSFGSQSPLDFTSRMEDLKRACLDLEPLPFVSSGHFWLYYQSHFPLFKRAIWSGSRREFGRSPHVASIETLS
ncbi:hypothetical protein CLOM_g3943 [Closterium sp. NIES-68]|nr:hypothetical protein CLOM_g3943 [Closterium sp. NIES-68]GJP66761.1 hypothetical protein CLOP_g23668 [Closterium sp. NIES-67]